MSDTILELGTLAPLLLRDGRPFAGGGEESRAQSLMTPLPSTLAGFVRTQMGDARGLDWQDLRGLSDSDLHERLKQLHSLPVRSVLVRDDQFMFHAPLNAVIREVTPKGAPNHEDKKYEVFRSLPHLPENSGTNAPCDLQPLGLVDANGTLYEGEDFKPVKDFDFWTAEQMKSWLLGQAPQHLKPIKGPPAEERTHVSIDRERGAGVDGELFSVTYRSFEAREREPATRQYGDYHRWALRIKTDLKGGIAPIGHLGGERRPVTLHSLGNDKLLWPNKGQFSEVTERLLDTNERRLCFMLTSPALFTHGWKPGWLDLSAEDAEKHDGNGLPAGVKALAGNVRLVGAAVGRRQAVSGWNLRGGTPKALRWAVPAGSVYFLQVTADFDRQNLVDAWLKPLSDSEKDQRDGFGCALWGVW